MVVATFSQPYKDITYLQDYADKFELGTENIKLDLIQVRSDRNNSINILSTKGLLQPWEKKLVGDQRYRPLTDQHIIKFDIYQDQFVYLTSEAVLSNAWAGKYYVEHQLDNPIHFVMGDNFTCLVAAREKLVIFQNNKLIWEKSMRDFNLIEILFDKDQQAFLMLTEDAIYTLKVSDPKLEKRYRGSNMTAMAVLSDLKEILVGTEDGILSLNADSFEEITPINKKLPVTHISCIKKVDGKIWFGSPKGAFAQRPDGKYDYYASKRWLVDDKVTDIFSGPDQSVLILTEKGLSKINFVEMTLEEKADYFSRKCKD